MIEDMLIVWTITMFILLTMTSGLDDKGCSSTSKEI
jgi:hypothetical protein